MLPVLAEENLLNWGISLLPFVLNLPSQMHSRMCKIGKVVCFVEIPPPAHCFMKLHRRCKRKEATLATGRYSCSFQHPSTCFTQGGVRFSLVDEALFPCRSRTRPLTFPPMFLNNRRLSSRIMGPGRRAPLSGSSDRHPTACRTFQITTFPLCLRCSGTSAPLCGRRWW